MREIELTQGKFALVDDEDFEFLNQWKWYAKQGRNTFYAERSVFKEGKKLHIRMHRVILGIDGTKILGDHIDHDGLNNQRYNLRVASCSQNGANSIPKGNKTSTKYLGISLHKQTGKWEAHLKKNYQKIYLGLFISEIEAAIAYNEAATIHHGEFANLNII